MSRRLLADVVAVSAVVIGVVATATSDEPTPLVVVEHWSEELKRLAPTN